MQREWMIDFLRPPSLVEVQFKRLPWNSPFHSFRCHLGTVTTQKPHRGSFITTDIYNPIFSLLIVDGKFMKLHIFSSGLELLALLQRQTLQCESGCHLHQLQPFSFIYASELCFYVSASPFCENQPKMERLVKMPMCYFRYQNSEFQGLS